MAADRSVRVEIRGGRELVRAFKQLETGADERLKAGFKDIARTIAGRAAAKVPRVSGRAASSIIPRSSGSTAGIAFGGSRAPYYPWLDFGGRVGRGKSIYRDLVNGGRYVYPTIAENRDDIAAMADDAIRDAAKSADFETRGSAD